MQLLNSEIIGRAAMCREEGIELGVFLIVGWPGETVRERWETDRILEQIAPADIQTSILKLYPGTGIYRRALAEGRIREEDWLNAERPFFPYVCGEEFAAAQEYARELEDRYQTHRIRRPFESQGDRYLLSARSTGAAICAEDVL
jgi:radical SAM superfamily enzyme YgiQ (UPF0313 family)